MSKYEFESYGHWGDEDYEDAMEGPDYYPTGRGKMKTCRLCGTNGLHWGLVDSKWRLFDDNNVHICPVHNISK